MGSSQSKRCKHGLRFIAGGPSGIMYRSSGQPNRNEEEVMEANGRRAHHDSGIGIGLGVVMMLKRAGAEG